MVANPEVGAPKLRSYYVTFGVKYRYETHPHWPAAHPDGWLLVLAPDEEEARLLLRRTISNKYAFLYDEHRFDKKWHPLGELGRIVPDGNGGIITGDPTLTARFTPQDPEYYGTESSQRVCARIEGILAEGSDTDAVEALGYEAEFVHHRCFPEGVALFKSVSEVDYAVMAGELDWTNPSQYVCPVCEEAIL